MPLNGLPGAILFIKKHDHNILMKVTKQNTILRILVHVNYLVTSTNHRKKDQTTEVPVSHEHVLWRQGQ